MENGGSSHKINVETNGNGHEDENLVYELTEDEAALYDRQIRLWGVDAQRKY